MVIQLVWGNVDLGQDVLDFRLCAQYNPLAKSDMELEAAGPHTTGATFPWGLLRPPGFPPLPHPKPANKHKHLKHTLPSLQDPAECSPPLPPLPQRPRMPSRSPGTSSGRNTQARTDPINLGWQPKSLEQHKKPFIPSVREGWTILPV